jgi:hypothetical protein
MKYPDMPDLSAYEIGDTFIYKKRKRTIIDIEYLMKGYVCYSIKPHVGSRGGWFKYTQRKKKPP